MPLVDSTVPVGGCTLDESGGYRQNERGFICPPDLLVVSATPDALSNYLPGTYRTRVFEVPMEFTRTEPFLALGENSTMVTLDYQSEFSQGYIQLHGQVMAEDFRQADLLNHECTVAPKSGQVTIGGSPAEYEFFSVAECSLSIQTRQPLVPFFNFPDGVEIRAYYINLPDRTLLLTVAGHSEEWGDYEVEVADGIIESIGFPDQ